MRKWYVYICNKGGLLYTGITTHIEHRMTQHKAKLLYKEEYDSKEQAAEREKHIKGWNRRKKIELIKGKLTMYVSLHSFGSAQDKFI